jgi:hypothetical protein
MKKREECFLEGPDGDGKTVLEWILMKEISIREIVSIEIRIRIIGEFL